MRNKFDEQLAKLHDELSEMGQMCEEAISDAVRIFAENDKSLIEKTLMTDSEIDRKERQIESLCMELLMRQQPVARDLREISSALKMISDMERIGDQAADIAEITRHMTAVTDKCKDHVQKMAARSHKHGKGQRHLIHQQGPRARMASDGLRRRSGRMVRQDEGRAYQRRKNRQRGKQLLYRPADDMQIFGAYRRSCYKYRGMGGILNNRRPFKGRAKAAGLKLKTQSAVIQSGRVPPLLKKAGAVCSLANQIYTHKAGAEVIDLRARPSCVIHIYSRHKAQLPYTAK